MSETALAFSDLRLLDWAWLALVFPLALGLTAAARRHALLHQVLDLPNARSSHRLPTPRGGGLAIVVSFFAAVGVLTLGGRLPPALAAAHFGAGVLVAGVGLIDDVRGLAARWRLLAHFAAAAWALYWLGGEALAAAPALPTGLLLPLAALALAWLLNLYNFMDGIDGLAGVEALTVAGSVALLAACADDGALAALALALALAAAGFLYWNWAPAKIFMGDVGSGFLGSAFGLLLLQAGARPQLLWAGVLLLGVFIVDATVTLLRRLLRGERIGEAHRSHAYQVAARRWRSHRSVSLAVAAINLAWLLPLAAALAAGLLDVLPALVLAWLPLLALALYLGAGSSGTDERPAQPA